MFFFSIELEWRVTFDSDKLKLPLMCAACGYSLNNLDFECQRTQGEHFVLFRLTAISTKEEAMCDNSVRIAKYNCT